MSDHLVRPVIRRANSVKEFGHSVMDSKVSNYAADRIDGAIHVADKYVERFLPEQNGQDEVDCECFINLNFYSFYLPSSPSCSTWSWSLKLWALNPFFMYFRPTKRGAILFFVGFGVLRGAPSENIKKNWNGDRKIFSHFWDFICVWNHQDAL